MELTSSGFFLQAQGRRKPSGTSGTSHKHRKHADARDSIFSSLWPSQQAEEADFKEVLKKVEADWERVQKREDKARSQRATNSLALRWEASL